LTGAGGGYPALKMAAPVETPPRGPANGRAQPPARWKGDDAVPRGLAVASAVILRVAIVVGGVVIVALGAARMMLVVLPVLIAVLLTTLLMPVTRWLRAHGWRPAPSALAPTSTARSTTRCPRCRAARSPTRCSPAPSC
jgi:hypothetical protein